MTQPEIEPAVRAKHKKIRDYLGTREGQALLKKHGLRRSHGPLTRAPEAQGVVDSIELHERWRGFMRPAGAIYVGAGAVHLNAVPFKEYGVPKQRQGLN